MEARKDDCFLVDDEMETCFSYVTSRLVTEEWGSRWYLNRLPVSPNECMQNLDNRHTMIESAEEPDTLIVEDRALRLGFIQLPKLVLQARNLSRDAKLLYAILLSYAWQATRCFPGYRRLCNDMQASENMVRKYMRELEGLGLLSQKRRGLGKTNIYTLHDLRTSHIAVLEPQEEEDPELPKTAGKEEPRKPDSEVNLRNSKANVSEDGKREQNHLQQEPIALLDQTVSHIAQPFRTPSRAASSPDFVPIGSAVLSHRFQTNKLPHRREETGVRSNRVPVSEQLDACISEISRGLGDTHHLHSNLTQASRLLQQSLLTEPAFVARLYEARAITKDRLRSAGQGGLYGVHKPMAYFWRVVRDLLKLDESDYENRVSEATTGLDHVDAPERQGSRAKWSQCPERGGTIRCSVS